MSTTARFKRYYRSAEPVLPVSGTTAPCYRPVLKPAPSPLDAPVLACGTTARKRYYRSQSGTTGDDRYYRSQVRYYRSCMCLRAPVGPQPMYPPLLTYSPSLSPNYPCLVVGL